jgi:hypothetical protein
MGTSRTKLKLTHDKLVTIGAAWIWGRGANIVVTEFSGGQGEIPDVLAWGNNSISILIEAKTSYGDFRGDKQKSFRKYPEEGIGCNRYYIMPSDLAEYVNKKKFPDKWGLLSVKIYKGVDKKTKYKVRILRKSGWFKHNQHKEIKILVSSLRRLGSTSLAITGMSVRFYMFDNKNKKTTLGIRPTKKQIELNKVNGKKNLFNEMREVSQRRLKML